MMCQSLLDDCLASTWYLRDSPQNHELYLGHVNKLKPYQPQHLMEPGEKKSQLKKFPKSR